MTVEELYREKEKTLEDYTKAAEVYKSAKLAYDKTTDDYMNAIESYRAKSFGYLEPIEIQSEIPVYRILYYGDYNDEDELYLLPDDIRGVEIGSFVNKGEYLIKIEPGISLPQKDNVE